MLVAGCAKTEGQDKKTEAEAEAESYWNERNTRCL
jgi:hypothetical protein